MKKISVKEKEQGNGWLFEVEIDEDGNKSSHTVELFKEDYERLTARKIKPRELIEKSFDFLLKCTTLSFEGGLVVVPFLLSLFWPIPLTKKGIFVLQAEIL